MQTYKTTREGTGEIFSSSSGAGEAAGPLYCPSPIAAAEALTDGMTESVRQG